MDAHAIIDMLRAERKELDRAIEAIGAIGAIGATVLDTEVGPWSKVDGSGRAKSRLGAYWKAWRARPPHTDDGAS